MFRPNYIKFTIIILFLTFCLSCKKQFEVTLPKFVDRTVLIYIAANNNLRDEAINSINKLEKGAVNLRGNLIVFVKTSSRQSYLLRIKYDNSDKIVSDTLKVYGTQNSSDPGFLTEVIKDSRSLSPARSYGLVMWSHATSWSPPTIKTKSFGNDMNYEMDIKDFKDAIPSDFEYILFDACSMGSLEVVFELKDKAKYLLTSPSEVLSSSFPYDVIATDLFGDVESLTNICKQFISYYNAMNGASASATVSLIRSDQLEPLVQQTKQLLESNKLSKTLDLSVLQRLDFDLNSIPAYDFISFLRNNFETQKYSLVSDQLSKAIIFKAHTDKFFNKPIKEFCGLTIYIQTKDNNFTNYYKTLKWYSSSGWNFLF